MFGNLDADPQLEIVAGAIQDRDAKTALALQAPKKALLGHVAQYAGRTTFEFPGRIDIERVTADLKDGVLTITLPSRCRAMGALRSCRSGRDSAP